jgi:hypothetical protein
MSILLKLQVSGEYTWENKVPTHLDLFHDLV